MGENMKKQKKYRGRICLCILFFSLFCMCSVVYASEIEEDLTNKVDGTNDDRFSGKSPWMNNADESIYSNSIDATEDAQKIEPEDPGMVEEYISELIRNAASSLISLLEKKLDAGIDKIIYGRVGSGKPNSANIYAFELRSGNPYGVTASVCYALLRSMVFVLLGINFVFLLAKSAWTGHTAQSRDQIKTNFYDIAMKFSFLTLMPYLFDVVLYVRDVILYGLKSVTGEMLAGGAQLSLSNAFLLNAEKTERFIDALMYLGTIGLTFYFAVIYIAIAIDMLVCFISFPILCMLQSRKRNLIDSWMMTVLSNMLTPILDAVLLLVPLLTSMMLSDVIEGVAIIQLIMCMLIIPSRNRIKVLLGVQNGERGGLFSTMALLALGRTLAGKAKGAFQRVSDIRSDMEKSKVHKAMAGVDGEENEALLGGLEHNQSIGKNLNYKGMDDGQEERIMEEMDTSDLDEAREPSLESYGSEYETIDDLQESSDYAMEDRDVLYDGMEENDNSDDVLKEENLQSDGIDNKTNQSDVITDSLSDTNSGIQNSSKEDGAENEEEGTGATVGSVASKAMNRNEMLRNLEHSMEEKQNTIDAMRSQKAGYLAEQKRLERQMLNHEKGTEEYRELERKRADIALNASEAEQRIANQMRNMNQLRNQAKSLRSGGMKVAPTKFDDARTELLCKRANINNFEQPEFRNALSNSQMSKLYKRRAGMNTVKGMASVFGGTAGTLLAGGSAVFMNPGTALISGSVGMKSGELLGSGLVSVGSAISSGVRREVHSIKGETAMDAGLGSDFKDTYEQVPVADSLTQRNSTEIPLQQTMNVVTKELPRNVVVPNTAEKVDADTVLQFTQQTEESIKRQIHIEIEQDSEAALKKIFTSSGRIGNSTALIALERANIETEKYLSTLRETSAGDVTRKLEREKRIEFQTQFITDEVLKKLSLSPDYEKGTEYFKTAEEIIRVKVRSIVEEKNKDIF